MYRNEEIFIVGGGPSLKGFDFDCLTNRKTIAINIAIFDTLNPDFFITVDYTFLSKLKKLGPAFTKKTCPKFFVVDFSCSDLKEDDTRGNIKDVRCNIVYKLAPFDIIIKARKAEGIGYSFKDFRTGKNSGFCALQLAVLLGYKKINLLGIDLGTTSDKSHYHDMYGGGSSFNDKLMMYYQYFKTGILQLKKEHPEIEIKSYSKNSPLNLIVDYVALETLYVR